MPCIEKSSLVDAGVSVVVPVLNGARWLPDVLAAIRAELANRPHEILVVDDGSGDESVEICRRSGDADVQVVDGPRRGAAAAVNAGLRLARFDLVAQIDQDVIVRPGWFATLIDALRDPHVAAAQGWYITDPAASALARVMSTRSRAALRAHRRRSLRPRLHRQRHLAARRHPPRRRARRNAGLRIRQRLELSPDRRRLPPGDSSRGGQRASLARRRGELPHATVRIRLRTSRPGGEAPQSPPWRCRLTADDDGAPGVDGAALAALLCAGICGLWRGPSRRGRWPRRR